MIYSWKLTIYLGYNFNKHTIMLVFLEEDVMQDIFEIVFDVAFLGTIFTLGYLLLKNKGDFTIHSLFGVMALVLGAGSLFYFITKIVVFFSVDSNKYATLLGIGKLVSSITVTLFLLILFMVYKLQYSVNNQKLIEVLFYFLGAARIILCLMPQNQWASNDPPIMWSIFRNIPFFIMSITLIILFVKEIRNKLDRDFIFMPFAIFFATIFFIPVTIWQDSSTLMGLFIMLRSLCYLWIIWMGYKDLKKVLLKTEIII